MDISIFAGEVEPETGKDIGETAIKSLTQKYELFFKTVVSAKFVIQDSVAFKNLR